MSLREALLYEKREEERVDCFLCNHRCRIAPGKFGICNVRENREGTLYTHSYGKLIARNLDPIEKKPLYHFLPGSFSYSIAAIGCNFQCGFCQNWEISQVREAAGLGIAPRQVEPAAVAEDAKKTGAASVSYTYTEPTIFFEFALDIARPSKGSGLANVFVTNGFMTKEMLRMMGGCLDAANVDLKSFRDETYRRVCRGRLAPVLENIEFMKKSGVWVEVTTLIVPGMNDSEEELRDIARFLAGVGPSVPWHVSRFHPQYKMGDTAATAPAILNRAYEIGREAGLRYTYVGNISGKGNHTFCWKCGRLLIERSGFSILNNYLSAGKCPQCSTPLDGVLE